MMRFDLWLSSIIIGSSIIIIAPLYHFVENYFIVNQLGKPVISHKLTQNLDSKAFLDVDFLLNLFSD